MAKLIRIVQSLLPLATVIVCVLLIFCFSDSLWLHDRIGQLHKDTFTVQLSLKELVLAISLVPKLLAASLVIFLLAKRHIAADHHWQWQRNYCLVAMLASLCLVLRLWQCPVAQDDSYIDYRYVQHWLAGQFDYNPGEHVMGFTSHLHLFTLWAICSLFHTQIVDMVSYYLNCALDTISTIFLYFFMLKVYGRAVPAFVGALFFAVSDFNCSQIISGKETALVNLVLILCLWSLKTSRLAILPWCANALFLLRPEGILSCLLILAAALKIRGRAAFKSFIVPCALTGAWYAFLLFYFGTVMPHGMIAKHKVLLAGPFFPVFLGGFTAVGNIITNSTLGVLLPGLEKNPFLPIAVISLVYTAWRFKEPCFVLYKSIVMVQLLFLLLTQPQFFGWYFCWFALLGPILLAQLTADAWPETTTGRIIPIMIMRATLCLVMIVDFRTAFFFAPYVWLPYWERGVVYREAALYLQDLTKGKEVIAASDVGLLGYFYTGPVLDVMGLISDGILNYYPIKTYHGYGYLIAPECISALRPKYLLAPMSHCIDMLADDGDFHRNYVELKRWTNPGIQDKVVCIWVRRDVAAQELAPPIKTLP